MITIASASQEQTEGIDQIGVAINQRNSVTQSNAANAEETASASQDLGGQGKLLRIYSIAAWGRVEHDCSG